MKISQILQFCSRDLLMQLMRYFLNFLISDDYYDYLSKGTTKYIQIYNYIDHNLQAIISASIGFPLTLFVPLSFFIISKKNRIVIKNDLKFLWKKLRCNRRIATIDVALSNDVSNHVGNRNQKIIIPARVVWVSDLRILQYLSWINYFYVSGILYLQSLFFQRSSVISEYR